MIIANPLPMKTTDTKDAVVFRRFALPVTTFDYLKGYQREHARLHLGIGETRNNNEMLEIILREHQQYRQQEQKTTVKTSEERTRDDHIIRNKETD